jgi:vacuolar-type H+-ATPase subunit H
MDVAKQHWAAVQLCPIRSGKPGRLLDGQIGEYRGEFVNERRVRQILDIESEAQAIYQEAVRKAEDLPTQAEREAQTIIEKTREDAHAQAQQLLDQAQGQDACDSILHQAREEMGHMEGLARSHFDRAVGYVLDRLTGRE